MTQLSNSKVYNLSGLDGVKDVTFGDASVEARAQRDFSKDGSAQKAGFEGSHDDVKARAERYGLDLDSSEVVGLGLT